MMAGTFLIGDAGAFYSGRSWADRGNRILNNHFSSIRNFGPPIPLQARPRSRFT